MHNRGGTYLIKNGKKSQLTPGQRQTFLDRENRALKEPQGEDLDTSVSAAPATTTGRGRKSTRGNI